MGAFGKIQRVPRFVVDKNSNEDQVYAASIMNVSGGRSSVLDGATRRVSMRPLRILENLHVVGAFEVVSS
jgi:hypothetical protein